VAGGAPGVAGLSLKHLLFQNRPRRVEHFANLDGWVEVAVVDLAETGCDRVFGRMKREGGIGLGELVGTVGRRIGRKKKEGGIGFGEVEGIVGSMIVGGEKWVGVGEDGVGVGMVVGCRIVVGIGWMVVLGWGIGVEWMVGRMIGLGEGFVGRRRAVDVWVEWGRWR
jgi:hypothetical protein